MSQTRVMDKDNIVYCTWCGEIIIKRNKGIVLCDDCETARKQSNAKLGGKK